MYMFTLHLFINDLEKQMCDMLVHLVLLLRNAPTVVAFFLLKKYLYS